MKYVVTWESRARCDKHWTQHVSYCSCLKVARQQYELAKTGDNFGPIEYRLATLAKIVETEYP